MSQGTRGAGTREGRAVAAKKPLDLYTQPPQCGPVLKSRPDFIELRDGSGHGGTRELVRRDDDDQGVQSQRVASQSSQYYRVSIEPALVSRVRTGIDDQSIDRPSPTSSKKAPKWRRNNGGPALQPVQNGRKVLHQVT